MKNILTQAGLFLDFIGCFILLIDSIRNSDRLGEHDIKFGYSLFWQKSYFKNLPVKAFSFLAIGFLLQFISSWIAG
ncbi:MAG: hypothetical protein WA133_10760 [Syntrophales bacterium]